MPSRAPHAQQERIALRLPDDSGDSGDMLTGIQEHDQLHALLAPHLGVVLLEVPDDLLDQLLLLLHPAVRPVFPLPAPHEVHEFFSFCCQFHPPVLHGFLDKLLDFVVNIVHFEIVYYSALWNHIIYLFVVN